MFVIVTQNFFVFILMFMYLPSYAGRLQLEKLVQYQLPSGNDEDRFKKYEEYVGNLADNPELDPYKGKICLN